MAHHLMTIEVEPITGKKNGYRSKVGGGFYKSTKVINSEHAIGWATRAALAGEDGYPLPKGVAIKLTVIVYQKSFYKGDLDNILGTIQDALEKVLYENDAWVVATNAYKVKSTHERVVIMAWEVDADDVQRAILEEMEAA